MTINWLLSMIVTAVAAMHLSNAMFAEERRLPVFPTVTGNMVDGTPLAIDVRRIVKPLVLMVLSPSCPYCNQSMPGWKLLIAKAQSGKYAFLVIGLRTSQSDLKRYLDSNGLTIPGVVDVSMHTLRAFQLDQTPSTLLFSPTRETYHAWNGPIERHRATIAEIFGVRLFGAPLDRMHAAWLGPIVAEPLLDHCLCNAQ